MTTSDLTISEQSLTFPKTVPGKPVFLVLRVATDEKDVQVTASTDLPTVFQLASDDRPIFGSQLSLTANPSGTYVHIRYQPDRSGVHEGTLTLHSAVGTRMVTLTGRSTRISAVQTNPNKVLTRTVASREAYSTTRRTSVLLAGAAVVTALLYTGLTYRCQLMPSLCRQDAADSPRVVISPSIPVAETPVSAPVPERVAAVKSTARRTAPKETDRNERGRNRVYGEERSAPAAEPALPAESKSSSADRQSANRPTTAKTARVMKPQTEPARPVKSVSETEESDLERELNGRTNQDSPR